MDANIKEVLENAESTIRCLETSLKNIALFENSTIGKELFNREEFWTQMPLLMQNCSKECTKFCLSFSSHPLPDVKASTSLCDNLQSSVLAVSSLFSLVPTSEGKRFWKYLQTSILAIVESTADLVNVTLEGPEKVKKQLQNTGTLWEACEKGLKMPRDNREVVVVLFGENISMVKDAYDELKELETQHQSDDHVSNLDELEHQLSERERQLLNPALNLIKVALAALTKIKQSVDSKPNLVDPVQLDKIADISDPISPEVDNLASSFFVGSSVDIIMQHATDLRNCVFELLKEFRTTQYCLPDDHQRLDFLNLALDHNYAKLQEEIAKSLHNVIAS